MNTDIAPIPANWSAPAAPVRWEYHVVHFKTGTKWAEIGAWLNTAGADGWELVSADVERNQRMMGAPQQTTCFFKRQRMAT